MGSIQKHVSHWRRTTIYFFVVFFSFVSKPIICEINIDFLINMPFLLRLYFTSKSLISHNCGWKRLVMKTEQFNVTLDFFSLPHLGFDYTIGWWWLQNFQLGFKWRSRPMHVQDEKILKIYKRRKDLNFILVDIKICIPFTNL